MSVEHGITRRTYSRPLVFYNRAGELDIVRKHEHQNAALSRAAPASGQRSVVLPSQPTTALSTPSTSSTTSSDLESITDVSSVSSLDSDVGPSHNHLNPRRTTAPNNWKAPYIPHNPHREIVEGLLTVVEQLLQTTWPQSRDGGISLWIFIREACRRSKTSFSTITLALYYLILLQGICQHPDFAQNQAGSPNVGPNPKASSQILEGQPAAPADCGVIRDGRKLFFSALILAGKYLQDRTYSTKGWSKISGLTPAEISRNEKVFLQSIDYRLHLKVEHYNNWSRVVLELCKLGKYDRRLDYSKIIPQLNVDLVHSDAKTEQLMTALALGHFNRPIQVNSCNSPHRGLRCGNINNHENSAAESRNSCERLGHPQAFMPPPNRLLSIRKEPQLPNIPYHYAFVGAASPDSSLRSSSSFASSPDSIFTKSDNVRTKSRSSSVSSVDSPDVFQAARDLIELERLPMTSLHSDASANQITDNALSEMVSNLGEDQTSNSKTSSTLYRPLSVPAKRKAHPGPSSTFLAAEALPIRNKNHTETAFGPKTTEDRLLVNKKPRRARGKESAKPAKITHTSEKVKARRNLQRDASRQQKRGGALPDALPGNAWLSPSVITTPNVPLEDHRMGEAEI